MFATMLRRDRERNGLRIARASWLVGVSVREYRELEAGARPPDWDTRLRAVRLTAVLRYGSVPPELRYQRHEADSKGCGRSQVLPRGTF